MLFFISCFVIVCRVHVMGGKTFLFGTIRPTTAGSFIYSAVLVFPQRGSVSWHLPEKEKRSSFGYIN